MSRRRSHHNSFWENFRTFLMITFSIIFGGIIGIGVGVYNYSLIKPCLDNQNNCVVAPHKF